MKNQENALVSVIIPVYGTEKYLEKCIDSVIEQTYKNLEIILVNDGSPDNSLNIMKRYQNEDTRVNIVDNSKNLGLFRARLEGSKRATGKYLTFIDSDDYIGIDFIRSMVKEAEAEDADIVKAQFVMENEKDGYRFIYNYINNRPKMKLEGDSIAENYFRQKGLDFSWHIVCGKLYSKKLWEKCKEYYEAIKSHLIMTEDIAYSTPLFLCAQKYVEIDCDTYFYIQRESASTGISKNLKKFEKNISDLKIAFDFREDILKQFGLEKKYEKNNRLWKENYARSWKNAIKCAGFNKREGDYLEGLVKEALGVEEITDVIKEDNYYYSCTTSWSEKEEFLKKKITNKKITCVSFDIFDTLISRPLFEPKDLFCFLDMYYRKLIPRTNLNFAKSREVAEKHARDKIRNTGHEEITLDQIYEQLYEECNINRDILKKIQNRERELEVEFCGRRNFGYELYLLALDLNKTVILTSDMYLDEITIKKILEKNGYLVYDKLFLSSTYDKCKSTGNLYNYIIKKYDKKRMIHIGDNYESDYKMPKKFGIDSIHIPRAVGVFKGEYKSLGYYSGNAYFSMIKPFGGIFDNKISMEFLSIRCMLGIVANKIFDNPYYTFDKKSDFNSDLYFMSYYALGMHLFGMVMDLVKKNMHRRKIHFVARDGFECKMIYDLVKKYLPNLPESNYLYLSRKAILPLSFQEPSDVYYIKDNIQYDSVMLKTPRIILRQFLGLDNISETLNQYICDNGFGLDNYFKNFDSFEMFLSVLSKKKDLLVERILYNNAVKQAFNNEIDKNDILFDIGYNGTAQKIMTNILGRPVDAYYAYVNKDKALVNEPLMGCKVQTFYDCTPRTSGAIRELMFSKGEASCIGYKMIDDKLIPVFENRELSYIECEIHRIINVGVLDFVDDFMSRFFKYLSLLPIRNYDISLPFEFLMERVSDKDKEVFSCYYFEDDVFSGKEKMEVSSWWKNYSLQQKREDGIGEKADDLENDRFRIAEAFYPSVRWKRVIVLLLLRPQIFIKKISAFLRGDHI